VLSETERRAAEISALCDFSKDRGSSKSKHSEDLYTTTMLLRQNGIAASRGADHLLVEPVSHALQDVANTYSGKRNVGKASLFIAARVLFMAAGRTRRSAGKCMNALSDLIS
jgi:hypothetical protein